MNVLKRIFHLLCDCRNFRWRTSRFVNLWGSWWPYIGFDFDFYASFAPGHRADPNDEDDDGWGAEFNVGGSLLWISFGLTIPNDDHPDDEFAPPPVKHCGCGRELSVRLRSVCEGCRQVPIGCTCCSLDCPDCATLVSEGSSHDVPDVL